LVGPRVLAACAALSFAAACDRGSRAELVLVHVASPGRPASDAMDAALAARPDVTRQLARVGVERREAVPPELAGELRGLGTAAYLKRPNGDVELVGIRRGASSPGALLHFVERVRAAHGGETEVDAAHWLEVGLPTRALAAVSAGSLSPTEQIELRVRALLALDEVAQASALVEGAASEHVTPLAQAMVHVAARRPSKAVACLEGDAARGPAAGLVLGRALLDLGERERAYAILGDVASGQGPEAVAAAELLASAITGKDLHSDH
jgi:hypothetical protein